MEIRQAFDISKLNASQPLGGSSHSKTFTKPCNVSTPLTRSPEKDTFGFSGKSFKPGKHTGSTGGLSPEEFLTKLENFGNGIFDKSSSAVKSK